MDLPEERKAIDDVIKQVNLRSFRSECFIASSESPKELCIRKASECDIFVGIYKNRYGFIPTEDNIEKLSVIEMEYNAAYEKKIPQLIFEYDNDKDRNKDLKKFLNRVKNFTYGNFIKKYQNIDDLKYNFLIGLIFQVFKLDEVFNLLDNDNINHLRSLVKDEINYKQYLLEINKHLDFGGFSQLNNMINPDLKSLFISPHLQHVDNLTEIKDIKTEDETINVEISNDVIESYEINLLFPFNHTLKKDSWANYKVNKLKKKRLQEIIIENSRIVILGPPGIGKTSLLKNCVLGLIDKDIYFPVLFSLLDFSLFLNNNKNDSIANYLNQKYSRDGFSESFITKHLDAGSCILMCDGLDEIFDIRSRKFVLKKIHELLARYGKNNKIIITSRLIGYNESPILDFEHYFIERMNKEQILDYIDRWYNLTYNSKNQYRNISHIKQNLKLKIQTDRSIFELSRTPLFLTLLCLLNSSNTLSNKRIDLYDNYLNSLLEVLDQNKFLVVKSMELTKNQLRKIIENIAMFYYENNVVKTTKYEIESFLRQELIKMNINNNLLDDIIDNFLKIVSERTGLFMESDLNTYSFSHNSFIDYLAARKLANSEISIIRESLFEKKNIKRNYEVIRFLASILEKQSSKRLNEFITYIFYNRSKYEYLLHSNLLLIVHSMTDNISIEKELLLKILTEIKIVLKQNDRHTFQFFKSLGKLLDTQYKEHIIKLLLEFEEYPYIVLNVLIGYEYDLESYVEIIKKCYGKLVTRDLEYIIHFTNERLKRLDRIGIELAQDLLKEKIENQFDHLLKEKREKDKLEQEKLQRDELNRKMQILSHFYNDIRLENFPYSVKTLNFSSLNINNIYSNILSSYNNISLDLEGYWKKQEKVNYFQLLKVINSFSDFGLQTLDPKSIINKKRRMVILLYILSTELKVPEINNYLFGLIESNSFEYKEDLIKLFFLGGQELPEKIQAKLKSDKKINDIIENYKYISNNFNSLQLMNTIKQILHFCPLFCYITCRIIKRYYHKLGTYLLEYLIQLSARYVEDDRIQSFYLVELITDYAKKGNTTIIGPLSGMIEEDYLNRITLTQKQILDIIDCSCELNPELNRREDVLGNFDPNAFYRLKQIIEDRYQLKSIRVLALNIYCEKFSGMESFDLLNNLLSDNDLAFDTARMMLKYNDIDEIIEKTTLNANIKIELKKLILLDRLGYNLVS